ncbi:patatin-like phospholipase family protein [Limnobacter sp.]|uniref:patatin-like phospholipase family protein n=1 Tax=Limnobacter sp. TaxID=2003368 RepID=UPI003516964E
MSTSAGLSPDELRQAATLLAKRLDIQTHQAEQLIGLARLVPLQRGDTLFQQGDASRQFYLILQGQLRGQRMRPDGQMDLTLSFYPGEMIGELGFFDQSLRTLTICARRDSVLLEIDQQALNRFGEHSHAVYQHLIRVLVARFKKELGYRAPVSQHQLIAFHSLVKPDGLSERAEEALCAGIKKQAELRRWSDWRALTLRPPVTNLPCVAEWLAVDIHTPLDERLIDDLDSMVVLFCASTLSDAQACEQLKARIKQAEHQFPVWLVLVHEAAWVEANVARRVREQFGESFRVLHVRHGNQNDFARVARHVLGRTLGLVLGGGGARGFAHAGFYRAIQEAGIVVDHVGGTSMGALVGALIASGRSAAEVEAVLAQSFKKGLPFKLTDYWIPRYGFVKSRAVDEVYHHAFGEAFIEDYPVPYFAVSCNLTTGMQHVFEQGLVWKAIRASTSIPVYFEPFLDGRQVMVDGALVNNVPADTMRAKGASKVMTVDVGLEEDITAHMADDGVAHMPSLMKSLMRVIELGGIEKSRQARVISDLHIQPDIQNIGLMEFERREEIVNLGYEAGKRAIPDILSLVRKIT